MAQTCCSPEKTPNSHMHTDVKHEKKNSHIKTLTKGLLSKIDPVLLAFGAILSLIALIIPSQTLSSLIFVGESIWDIAPYLAVSIAFAAYVKATDADVFIGKAFRSRTSAAIIVASFMGALSPFCSCGVVPLIAALLSAGVPLAPVMAFWLSSPVIDPEMMLVTTGILGIEFALAKTFAAVALGMMGGSLTAAIQKMGGFKDPLAASITVSCGASAITNTQKPVWKFWHEEKRNKLFTKEAKNTSWFLLKWLSIAFLLEGLMRENVPLDSVGQWLADTGALAIPFAALIGAPAYLNGYAAIPLTSGFLELGLNPGAALAFMVAGGATCIPAAVAVKALTKTPVFLTFIAVALFGSMIIGFAFSGWLILTT